MAHVRGAKLVAVQCFRGRIISTVVGRVLFNAPFHERRRVKENPPYSGFPYAGFTASIHRPGDDDE